ncbi:hypothetical protein [Formosa algae]|uniref:Uncharacterized protein n=1 Tax=Formosa algae TaxID=225843 RepID=A0A9X1CCY9_9FLAO|nr:hypothetical protein [Formosa algae]MBP1840649.1 hypothetical protein [Formosa algae]MDQ0335938.1 hypothetical protein [Formosa algae]
MNYQSITKTSLLIITIVLFTACKPDSKKKSLESQPAHSNHHVAESAKKQSGHK